MDLIINIIVGVVLVVLVVLLILRMKNKPSESDLSKQGKAKKDKSKNKEKNINIPGKKNVAIPSKKGYASFSSIPKAKEKKSSKKSLIRQKEIVSESLEEDGTDTMLLRHDVELDDATMLIGSMNEDDDATVIISQPELSIGFRLIGDSEYFYFTNLNEPITIGRSDENTLWFEDREISREHMIIEKSNNQIILTDLGSSNGTIINGKKVTGKNIIDKRAEVKIGQTTFLIDIKSN